MRKRQIALTFVSCGVGLGVVGFVLGEVCPVIWYHRFGLNEPFGFDGGRDNMGVVHGFIGLFLGLIVASVSLVVSPPPTDMGARKKASRIVSWVGILAAALLGALLCRIALEDQVLEGENAAIAYRLHAQSDLARRVLYNPENFPGLRALLTFAEACAPSAIPGNYQFRLLYEPRQSGNESNAPVDVISAWRLPKRSSMLFACVRRFVLASPWSFAISNERLQAARDSLNPKDVQIDVPVFLN